MYGLQLYLLYKAILLQTVQKNLRLQKIITAIAIALFFIKMAAWYLTGSVAILTDALESTVNVIAGLIGVYSLYVSAKPKDWDHPYGHGKAEFISAAVEGTLIIVAGIVIICQAIGALLHPHKVGELDYGIYLIGFTAIINYIAGSACVKTGKKNNSIALIASGKHLQTDTYSTIGIIAGLVLLYYLRYNWIDSATAMLFSFIIIRTGYKILRQSLAGIMDEADEELLKKMVTVLNENRRANWIDLHNLRIIKYGAVIHIDCHLTVPWYLNINEAHHEIDVLSGLVKNEFGGEAIELFIHSDGCVNFSCPICTKQDCTVRQQPFIKKIEWTIENVSIDTKHHL
jgi:cation diffusion facilitator family transporter